MSFADLEIIQFATLESVNIEEWCAGSDRVVNL
jgi:hypothetical protein